MLVLARRSGERLVFPSLGMTVEVVSMQRNNVRLGIDAPPDVRVFREEVLAGGVPEAASSSRQSEHDLRGQLNVALMGLATLQSQIEKGEIDEARALVNQLMARFDSDASPKPQRRTTATALIVEDNRAEAETLSGLLRSEGYDVAIARDGIDALDYLEHNQQPNFILLDMRMPRCDGPATLAAIRRNPSYRGLRIFGVSGSDAAEFAGRLGRAQVDGWFRKPLRPEELIQQLQATVTVC